ncbi:TPA: glycosyltransferase family 2 protein [Staphylococcus aureus]|nr:glycosyltransferase family 2 protein [Staphylococcus aureus]
MKRKSLYLLCFLILPLFLITGATADAVANPVGKPTHAVDAKIEKYKVDDKADGDIDLERYRIWFQKDEDWNPFGKDEVAETVNNVTNFFFEIDKLIVSITDYAVESLYQLDVLNDFADKVGQFVGDIYQKLLSNIVMTLFIVICLNAFIVFSVKGNMHEALKRGFLIFCLIGFGVGVLANASFVIKGTNNVGKGLNNVIMNSTSSINGDIDYVNENSGVNKIRNQYFDMALYKPYLIMNYGTVNEDKIKNKGKKRIDNILDIKVKDEKTEKEVKEKIDDEVKKYDNTAMKQTHVFGQLGIAMFTLIITIALSIIFLSISFAKVIFSAFALVLFLFLAFSWLISFIPGFEISVFKALARTLGYIILSACMTFLFVVIGFSIDIANAFVKPESQQAYFLNVIFLMIILFVMYKKRSEIIDFVTRGNLSLSPQKLGAEVIRKGQDEFNKRRQALAEDKKNKRDGQRDNPEPPMIYDNPNNRNQQPDTPISMNHSKEIKRRNQQEEMHGAPNVGLVSYSKPSYSKPSGYTKPKRIAQDDSMHRDVKHKKEIKRKPQTESFNPTYLSQPPKEVSRRSQSSNKEVQSSYDKNIEKRRIQTGEDKPYQPRSHTNESTFKRNTQTKHVNDRLNNQKDINKHGK